MVDWFLGLGPVAQYLLLAASGTTFLVLFWGALVLGARAGGRGAMPSPYQREWPKGTRTAAAYAYRPRHRPRRYW